MAQVVIFAPSGEDVSAGQTALEGAGHTVEVVEATAANLLHMAIGMVDDTAVEDPLASDAPITEPTEEPAPEQEPAEEPTTEALGDVYIDGEQVTAYLDRSLSFPLIRVLDLTGDSKLSYRINESEFSYWRDAGAIASIRNDAGMVSTKVSVGRAANFPHVVLDQATAKRLRLV